MLSGEWCLNREIDEMNDTGVRVENCRPLFGGCKPQLGHVEAV